MFMFFPTKLCNLLNDISPPHNISSYLSLHDALSKAHMMLLFYTFFKDNIRFRVHFKLILCTINAWIILKKKDHNFFREVSTPES